MPKEIEMNVLFCSILENSREFETTLYMFTNKFVQALLILTVHRSTSLQVLNTFLALWKYCLQVLLFKCH